MDDLSQLIPSWTNLLIIPGILVGFTVHELGHAFIAYLFGDLSQVERGRITLNPFRHISWFGTFTFVLFGFGWARPVRVDASHFKNRYFGLFLVAIAGAAANLLLAAVSFVLTLMLVTLVSVFSSASPWEILGLLFDVRFATSPDIVALTAAFTIYVVSANLILAFFNLIPFPTLDGFTAVASLVGMLRDNETQPDERPTPEPTAPIEKPTLSEPRSTRRPVEIHFDVGAEYHATGNYEDAIARYRQAIASDSTYGPAYVNLGLAHLALDQRTRAIQAFRGATQYASDEESRTEAWAQLQKLSEYRPETNQSAQSTATAEPPHAVPETGPWADTRSTAPNWLTFGLTSLLALATAGIIYTYLAIALILYLS
jgi:Zn-dependent protease